MGLLDDAIREHLELKRLRGADPSEVAREERAALGPREPDGVEEPDFDSVESADEASGYDEEPPAAERAARAESGADRSTGADTPRSSEETMEVDMSTIIDADLGHDDGDLGLSGEAMATNAYDRHAGSASSSGLGGPDWEPREWHRPAARPVRALGLGGGPSVEGSLP
jgi:hypothetical protein